MDEKYQHLIGKTLEEARSLTSMQIRVMNRDGKSLMGTADFRTDRINVSIKENKIVTIRGIG